MVGTWTFRIVTSAIPFLTGLEVQLQQHSIDLWALGASAVATAIVIILHFGRAQTDPAPPTSPTTLG